MAGNKNYGCFTFFISKFDNCIPFFGSRSKEEKREDNRSKKRIEIVEPPESQNHAGKLKKVATGKATAKQQENTRKTSTTSTQGTISPKNHRRKSSNTVEKSSSSYTRKLNDAIDLDDTCRGNKYIATTASSSIAIDKTSNNSNVNRQRWKRGLTLIKETKHEPVINDLRKATQDVFGQLVRHNQTFIELVRSCIGASLRKHNFYEN